MTQNHPLQKIKNFIHLLQSLIANIKYGFPARKLKIIAVTGTDGKTTSTSLLYHIFKEAGLAVAFISTIKAKIGDKEIDTGLHVTTPEPWDVPRYLQMMVKQGIKYVILESTSNGLQQNRLFGVKFTAATITNIGSDHLDYHQTWQNYAEAKFLVAKKLIKNGSLVLNADHKSSSWLKNKIEEANLKIKTSWYQITDVQRFQQTFNGMTFSYLGQDFKAPLIGSYNLQNILGAILIAKNFIDLKQIALALKSFPIPSGRMQIIQSIPFTVIIDFAHTPGALHEALSEVNKIRSPESKLITAFGCAGRRDKARRQMGAVSAELADITILTAEDPRDEDLKNVNDEILAHTKTKGGELVARFANHNEYKQLEIKNVRLMINEILQKGKKPVFAFDANEVSSREDAIDLAIKIAEKNDIVFTTGKAHEQSLAFGNPEIEYPWSEHQVVQTALRENEKLKVKSEVRFEIK